MKKIIVLNEMRARSLKPALLKAFYWSVSLVVVLFMVAGYAEPAAAELVTLRDGLSLVTENSRFIRISRQDENIAEADAVIARSKMLPSVNASVSRTDLAHQPAAIFGPNTVAMSEKDFMSYNLNIQQTLYDFRANASRYEAGRIMVETKKMDSRRIRNLVAIDFALAYFDLLESDKILLVAEKEVESLQSHLRDAKNLYEEGVITKNDMLQAEVRLSDARQRLFGSRTLRQLNASRLNNALVRPIKSDIQVTDIQVIPEDIITAEADLEKAWMIAEQQRPELQIVDATMKALELEGTARKAEYYPKLFVRGAYDYTENRYQVHEGNWALTFGMGMNLFSGGSTRAEIGKIQNSRLKLVEQRHRLIEEIRLEVERYLLNAKTAKERIEVSRESVHQAEENLRINRSRYEEGVGTATEVLDAVTLMTVAETNYYKSLYDMQKAEAAVIYATGKDLLEVYK